MNDHRGIALIPVIAPSGWVSLVEASDSDQTIPIDGTRASLLRASFHESSVAGLTCLASSDCEGLLPEAIDFWRTYAQSYFKALCRQSTSVSHKWNGPQPCDDDSARAMIDAAPPMRGIEYLTVESLRLLWSGLDAHTRDQVSTVRGGLSSYLQSLNRAWNLVGRVTFHLAENKRDEQRPFAFLATYTEGQLASGSIQHVPLAEALKESVLAKNSERLDALLEPVQRASQGSSIVKQLLDSRNLFSPQAWSIGEAYQFLSHLPQIEEAGVIVRVPNWWNAARPPRPQVNVRIGNQNRAGMGLVEALDFNVDVALDGEPLNADELEKLLAACEGMTLLRGKWVQVDHERLQSALAQWQLLQKQHANGINFLDGLRLLSGTSMGIVQIDEDIRGWSRIEPGSWLRETLDTLRDPNGKLDLENHGRLNATLRPYQADGVKWLWFITQLGLGACLADDMGLGKTIQVIALLLNLKFAPQASKASKNAKQNNQQLDSPSLLIVPTSLLGNWRREVERFAPDLRLLIAHRSQTDADTLRRIAAAPQEELAGYDLVATTYGLARRDDWLAKLTWRMIILDEAQAIKNAGSTQAKSIKKLKGQGRIILTGTPVENHVGDLWSLFDFCSPGLLGSASEFRGFVKNSNATTKGVKRPSKNFASLRRLIRPYVLRRLKTDPLIAPDLPDKTEMRVDCGLTGTQAALYRKIVDELELALDTASGIQRQGIVLAVLMQLKQVCNHPSLYLKRGVFEYQESGKYAELRLICETIREKQEKLLVFSQFQSMCEPLANFLDDVFGRSGLVLTGKTSPRTRNKLVSEFQEESGPPFLVISVKAGGIGLNLTQASHVVHFDRWWNPAVEDQATDRAFRIGQKRNVLVHKFVCRGTLEERIDQMIFDKKAISHELFGEGGELNLTEMTNAALLKFVSLDINRASEI